MILHSCQRQIQEALAFVRPYLLSHTKQMRLIGRSQFKHNSWFRQFGQGKRGCSQISSRNYAHWCQSGNERDSLFNRLVHESLIFSTRLDFENPLPWLLLLHSSPSEFWTIYNEFPVQDVPQYGTRNWLCAVDTRSLGLIGEQFMSKLPLDLLTHIDKLRGIDVYKILQWLSHGSWEKKWAILKFNPMLAMAYSLAKTGFQKWDVCVQEEFKLFLSKVPLEHFRKSVLHNIFCAFQSKLGIEAMREYGSQSWFIDDLLGGKPVELLMEVVQKSKGDIEKRSEMLKQVRDLWKVVQRIRQRSGIHPRRPLCSFKDLLDYYRHAVREWEPLLWNGGAYSDKEIPVPWSDKYQTSTRIPIKTVRQWDICADLIGVHSVRSIEHEFPALARVGVYAYYQNTDFPQIILVEEKQPLAWQRRGWMSLGHWYWWNGKFF